MSNEKKGLSFPFNLIEEGVKLGFTYWLNKKNTTKTSADYDGEEQYRRYLHPSNKGVLLDGNDLRLSEQESFKNVCVMARIGTGKTTRYIIPNVLDKANNNCSLVVNDPKGEVFQSTSGYMKKKGFNVIVINPENLQESSYFNPLLEARNEIEIEQMAEILVRSGIQGNGGKDDFWLQGAIRFMNLFIKCLKNAAVENLEYYNLHNLYYLFQNFGEDGPNLDDFMARYTVYPDDPENMDLLHEWRGVLTGNKEGVQSFVLNGITALKNLSNKNIAQLTSKSDINLEDIRKQKTIIYFITPAQHGEYYSFLTSLFFRSVFNACMRKMPTKKTLPVYILYDEFGHSSIPGFVSTINTIRGYNVSMSVILQSISQLKARYGEHYAEAIQGGFNTYITFAGADPATTKFFEDIIGKVRERQKINWDHPNTDYREYNLINADEVRRLQELETLIVSSNQQPIKITTTPYYQNWHFQRQAKKGACQMPIRNHRNRLTKVDLQSGY